MDRKTASELRGHVFGTYFSLRIGLAAIGIALPIVVLVAGGTLHHVWFEDSMSAYYHTPPRLNIFTTRDLFVGGLIAASACLYLYKGFSNRENLALNLAGVFAFFTALLPTAKVPSDRGLVSIMHGTLATLFFLCIAYVSLFCARDTLGLLKPASQARYKRFYCWTGLIMIAAPMGAVFLSYTLKPGTLVFWVETGGVWAFALYWIIKTQEMQNSNAERRALDAELRREIVTVAPPSKTDTIRIGGPLSRVARKLFRASGEAESIVPADSQSGPWDKN